MAQQQQSKSAGAGTGTVQRIVIRKAFWHQGRPVPVGETISVTLATANAFPGNLVSPRVAAAQAAVAAATEESEPEE